ncbi:T9SS type A sorting domain-containing protein [Adhaeribacter sp. BT258]|uniref:T9SS type A sorting domain-containing protein n=1 Tax=Adhaeribacter terrigena TaxID=2793070 RepID=A0ABS1C4Q5_9BACT|nr:T9SS type A sorting domain-containing protein [Adhaeribacter terrigena]MBK0404382.1 T9SS type A sorting domain-containing protein [Adhaeribacter terrigena]
MKRLLPLSLFLWMLTGVAWGQTCTTTITTFPYFENFEGANHGWTTGGSNNSWALGTPAKSAITGAASGTKAWTTNPTGNYNNDEDSYVLSPCLNMSTMIAPIVQMKIWWDSENGWDGTVLQASTNGGTTWQTIGTVGAPNNWYNNSSISGAPGGQSIGWSGSGTLSSGGWVTAKHVLTGLGGQANVRLRLAFGSDLSVNSYDGVAFDDFTIYDTPANDAGVTVINSPATPVTPGAATPVQVTVKNYGTSPLTSATLGFRIGNGPVTTINHTFTTPLALNASSTPITIGSNNFAAGTYTVKAWTRLPNGVADGLPFNDTTVVSVIACNALSGTLTINKNAPSSATNFTSFASAVQAISSCGISGPVTFNVVAGSGPYNEKITIGNVPGTTALNTVTFNGNGNVLSSGISSTDAMITLNGTKYMRFNNLVLNADPNSLSGSGLYLTNGAQNNHFTGNTVSLSTSTTSTSYGIRLQTGANTNNLFQNNIVKGGYYGVYNYGSSAAPANNNQYINNQIRDPYYYGMYFYYGANNLIEGNDISRATRTNGGWMYGMYFSTASTGNTISKNRIHNVNDVSGTQNGTIYGIYIAVGSSVGSENVVKNNAIYNVVPDQGSAYGFYNSGGNGTHYIHNTVALHNPNYTGTGTLRGMYFLSASTNVKFTNNIISIDAGTTGTKHAIYLGSTTISLVSNGNNYYVPGGSVGYYSSNRNTLADWKTVNSNAYDQASVSSDPLYFNLATGNLRPNSVAIDNAGISGQNVPNDIVGTVRSTTTPDPGAYEFSVPPNDVAVIAVSGPVSGCGQTNQETVTVTIKNFGSNTQTSIPVSYKVNGTATGTGTWTGTLPPNATATHTFTTKANLAARGTYDIEGSTNLTSDQDNTNNATTLTVANALLPNMPVTLNFEAPLSGLDAAVVVTNKYSMITEGAAASKGTGSTKGMIMEGIDHSSWEVPVGITDPWLSNPDFFSAIRMCLNTAVNGNDSIIMTFDLKQLYKTTHYNTNFRIAVNGRQIPVYENGKLKNTLNPPFGGYDSQGAPWKAIKVDLTPYRNTGVIQISFGSSVKEGYQNGSGTANLIDNIEVFTVAGPTGVKENILQSNVVVFPNPSNGLFNLKVPATTRNYSVEVMDLTGKLIKQQTVTNNAGTTQLNLNGTAKGIYILKIASEGNVATRKLIVE